MCRRLFRLISYKITKLINDVLKPLVKSISSFVSVKSVLAKGKKGYVAILLAVGVPTLIYAVKYAMDSAIFTSWNIFTKENDVVYKKCSTAIAHDIALYYNPYFSFSSQSKDLYILATSVYDRYPEYHASIVGRAIDGLERIDSFNKKNLKVTKRTSLNGRTGTPLTRTAKSCNKYTLTLSNTVNPYYGLYRYIDLYMDNLSAPPSVLIWKYQPEGILEQRFILNSDVLLTPLSFLKKNEKQEERFPGIRPFSETLTSEDAAYVYTNARPIYSNMLSNLTTTDTNGPIFGYSGDSKATFCSFNSNFEANNDIGVTGCSSSASGTTEDFVDINGNVEAFKKNCGINISLKNDLIKVVTKSFDDANSRTGKDEIAYAAPAECNVDIVLSIPTNEAACNKDNRDAASSGTSGETFVTAAGATADAQQTPIYQIAQGYRYFLRKHFFNTKGVNVGLVPYSGKISLPPNRADWTTEIQGFDGTKFVEDVSAFPRQYKPYVRSAVLYGTSGVKGASLERETDSSTTASYAWGDNVTLWPIMFRRGVAYRKKTDNDENTDKDLNEAASETTGDKITCGGNEIWTGDIISNEAPNDAATKFLRMNPNPCYFGCANFLNMRCDSKCVTYLPNPYYIIELTANVQKVYEILGTMYPFYDPYNVSNFTFLPIVWANNLFSDWTKNPERAGSDEYMTIESKKTTGRKKVVILVVNKPDFFEAGELTYLGFNNDYSEISMSESDKIVFDGSSPVKGYKGILQFTGKEYNSGKRGNMTLKFPKPAFIEIVVSGSGTVELLTQKGGANIRRSEEVQENKVISVEAYEVRDKGNNDLYSLYFSWTRGIKVVSVEISNAVQPPRLEWDGVSNVVYSYNGYVPFTLTVRAPPLRATLTNRCSQVSQNSSGSREYAYDSSREKYGEYTFKYTSSRGKPVKHSKISYAFENGVYGTWTASNRKFNWYGGQSGSSDEGIFTWGHSTQRKFDHQALPMYCVNRPYYYWVHHRVLRKKWVWEECKHKWWLFKWHTWHHHVLRRKKWWDEWDELRVENRYYYYSPVFELWFTEKVSNSNFTDKDTIAYYSHRIKVPRNERPSCKGSVNYRFKFLFWRFWLSRKYWWWDCYHERANGRLNCNIINNSRVAQFTISNGYIGHGWYRSSSYESIGKLKEAHFDIADTGSQDIYSRGTVDFYGSGTLKVTVKGPAADRIPYFCVTKATGYTTDNSYESDGEGKFTFDQNKNITGGFTPSGSDTNFQRSVYIDPHKYFYDREPGTNRFRIVVNLQNRCQMAEVKADNEHAVTEIKNKNATTSPQGNSFEWNGAGTIKTFGKKVPLTIFVSPKYLSTVSFSSDNSDYITAKKEGNSDIELDKEYELPNYEAGPKTFTFKVDKRANATGDEAIPQNKLKCRLVNARITKISVSDRKIRWRGGKDGWGDEGCDITDSKNITPGEAVQVETNSGEENKSDASAGSDKNTTNTTTDDTMDANSHVIKTQRANFATSTGDKNPDTGEGTSEGTNTDDSTTSKDTSTDNSVTSEGISKTDSYSRGRITWKINDDPANINGNASIKWSRNKPFFPTTEEAEALARYNDVKKQVNDEHNTLKYKLCYFKQSLYDNDENLWKGSDKGNKDTGDSTETASTIEITPCPQLSDLTEDAQKQAYAQEKKTIAVFDGNNIVNDENAKSPPITERVNFLNTTITAYENALNGHISQNFYTALQGLKKAFERLYSCKGDIKLPDTDDYKSADDTALYKYIEAEDGKKDENVKKYLEQYKQIYGEEPKSVDDIKKGQQGGTPKWVNINDASSLMGKYNKAKQAFHCTKDGKTVHYCCPTYHHKGFMAAEGGGTVGDTDTAPSGGKTIYPEIADQYQLSEMSKQGNSYKYDDLPCYPGQDWAKFEGIYEKPGHPKYKTKTEGWEFYVGKDYACETGAITYTYKIKEKVDGKITWVDKSGTYTEVTEESGLAYCYLMDLFDKVDSTGKKKYTYNNNVRLPDNYRDYSGPTVKKITNIPILDSYTVLCYDAPFSDAQKGTYNVSDLAKNSSYCVALYFCPYCRADIAPCYYTTQYCEKCYTLSLCDDLVMLYEELAEAKLKTDDLQSLLEEARQALSKSMLGFYEGEKKKEGESETVSESEEQTVYYPYRYLASTEGSNARNILAARLNEDGEYTVLTKDEYVESESRPADDKISTEKIKDLDVTYKNLNADSDGSLGYITLNSVSSDKGLLKTFAPSSVETESSSTDSEESQAEASEEESKEGDAEWEDINTNLKGTQYTTLDAGTAGRETTSSVEINNCDILSIFQVGRYLNGQKFYSLDFTQTGSFNLTTNCDEASFTEGKQTAKKDKAGDEADNSSILERSNGSVSETKTIDAGYSYWVTSNHHSADITESYQEFGVIKNDREVSISFCGPGTISVTVEPDTAPYVELEAANQEGSTQTLYSFSNYYLTDQHGNYVLDADGNKQTNEFMIFADSSKFHYEPSGSDYELKLKCNNAVITSVTAMTAEYANPELSSYVRTVTYAGEGKELVVSGNKEQFANNNYLEIANSKSPTNNTFSIAYWPGDANLMSNDDTHLTVGEKEVALTDASITVRSSTIQQKIPGLSRLFFPLWREFQSCDSVQIDYTSTLLSSCEFSYPMNAVLLNGYERKQFAVGWQDPATMMNGNNKTTAGSYYNQQVALGLLLQSAVMRLRTDCKEKVGQNSFSGDIVRVYVIRYRPQEKYIGLPEKEERGHEYYYISNAGKDNKTSLTDKFLSIFGNNKFDIVANNEQELREAFDAIAADIKEFCGAQNARIVSSLNVK